MTAQLAVGSAHPNHGGIIPTQVAWLSENGRAAWTLSPTVRGQWSGDESWVEHDIIWIPAAPDHILEDGLLLIAVHVLRHETLRQLAHAQLPDLIDGSLVDLGGIADDGLAELRECARHIEMGQKLVVTVLDGSSLASQLPALEGIAGQLEVCTVAYSRTFSDWASEPIIRGSLAAGT